MLLIRLDVKLEDIKMAKIYDLIEKKYVDDGQNGLCLAAPLTEKGYGLKVGRYHIFLNEEEKQNLLDNWK